MCVCVYVSRTPFCFFYTSLCSLLIPIRFFCAAIFSSSGSNKWMSIWLDHSNVMAHTQYTRTESGYNVWLLFAEQTYRMHIEIGWKIKKKKNNQQTLFDTERTRKNKFIYLKKKKNTKQTIYSSFWSSIYSWQCRTAGNHNRIYTNINSMRFWLFFFLLMLFFVRCAHICCMLLSVWLQDVILSCGCFFCRFRFIFSIFFFVVVVISSIPGSVSFSFISKAIRSENWVQANVRPR